MTEGKTIFDQLYDLRSAIYEKFWSQNMEQPDIVLWMGHEARMRLLRDADPMRLPTADNKSTIVGMRFETDPGQALDAITVTIDGTPVFLLDTRHATRTELLTPSKVTGKDLELLALAFRDGDRLVVRSPNVMLATNTSTLFKSDPEEIVAITKRSLSMGIMQSLGLVSIKASGHYLECSLTFAGRNAVNQYRAHG